jgi:transposase
MGWLFRRGCNLHFLQGGTPGESMCLPWRRQFQNAKNEVVY